MVNNGGRHLTPYQLWNPRIGKSKDPDSGFGRPQLATAGAEHNARVAMTTTRTPGLRLVHLALFLSAGAIVGWSGVRAADLVGTWTMTEPSRQYLPAELRTAVPKLTLYSDGTFTAVDLPGTRQVGSTLVPVARSARGVWTVAPTDGTNRVQLRFQEEDYGQQLFISDWASDGPGSATKLYYFDGDPDSGRRILFTR